MLKANVEQDHALIWLRTYLTGYILERIFYIWIHFFFQFSMPIEANMPGFDLYLINEMWIDVIDLNVSIRAFGTRFWVTSISVGIFWMKLEGSWAIWDGFKISISSGLELHQHYSSLLWPKP